MSHQILHLSENAYLAYNNHTAKQNNLPHVIFLSGYMSDMQGSKAIYLQLLCEAMGLNFIRFDYEGTGLSSGDIKDGSISKWKQNAKTIIEKLGGDKNILIGSSMGGWLMSLLALEIPEKIHSLIGIASAPDFTERLIWEQLDKTTQNSIMEKGFYSLPTEHCDDPSKAQPGYNITKLLIEDARKNLLLNNDKIAIKCPVTLIHGMKDVDVPYQFSMDLAAKIISQNVEVILQENGKHRMSEPENLSLLKEVLEKHINIS